MSAGVRPHFLASLYSPRRQEDTVIDLSYSDGIAAARTMIVLEANASALQRRLPTGWELVPYSGDDLRGSSLRGANLLVPFHEVYAVRSHEAHISGLPQLSYVPFGTAGTVYAGNGVSATTAGSPNAVSQYDVACFQVSQPHSLGSSPGQGKAASPFPRQIRHAAVGRRGQLAVCPLVGELERVCEAERG
jgi:hypothetical protein